MASSTLRQRDEAPPGCRLCCWCRSPAALLGEGKGQAWICGEAPFPGLQMHPCLHVCGPLMDLLDQVPALPLPPAPYTGACQLLSSRRLDGLRCAPAVLL